jgi:hypothetical protein
MNAAELHAEATRRGLRLEPAGDKLAVIPKGKCPPDFAAVLRQHKPELLSWLEARAHNLPLDCAPWLHVARQVLAGEFAGLALNSSFAQSIIIGLRSIPHPICQSALERLGAKQISPANNDRGE